MNNKIMSLLQWIKQFQFILKGAFLAVLVIGTDLLLIGCNPNLKKSVPSEKTDQSSTVSSEAPCAINEIILAPCYVDDPEVKLSSAIGDNLTNWSNPTGSSTLSMSIPNGFYKEKSVLFTDPNFIASNIVNGVNIFDVSGNASPTPLDCTVSGLQNASCSVTNASYWSNILGTSFIGNEGLISLTIPAGYYGGSETLSIYDSDLSPNHILNGTTIFGVTGNINSEIHSACNSNGQVSCATNSSFVAGVPQGNLSLSNAQITANIPAGYYDGTESITLSDTNLLASNIKSGITLFGVNGSLIPRYNDCSEDSGLINGSQCTTSTSRVVTDTIGSDVTNWSNGTSSTTITSSIPQGYYSGKVCTFTDADLVASNLKTGTSIFGVTGNLISAYSDCSEDSGTLNAAACSTTATGRYISSIAGGNITSGSNPTSGTSFTASIPDGYYKTKSVSMTDTDLLSSNIKNGVNLFGVTGTAIASYSACTDNSLNATSCSTEANRYIYTANYGGRSLACSEGLNGSACWTDSLNQYITSSLGSNISIWTNILSSSNVAGSIPDGYYPGNTISFTDANLLAENIKSGVSLFNVMGTYSPPSGVELASNMHRDQSTSQISMNTEVISNTGTDFSNSSPGYRAVPKISIDDDGTFLAPTNVTRVDRAGWTNTCDATTGASGGTANSACKCGLSGTIEQRISNCASHGVIGTNATWDGSTKGNAGQGTWKLVTRTANISGSGKGREVWRDERTKLLWSSQVAANINWCKASGSNFITNNPAAQDDPSNICDNSANQTTGTGPTAKAISVCFEDGENYFTSTDPQISIAGKGGLGYSSTPRVGWRLPTRYDFQMADINGYKLVFPDTVELRSWEWSSTLGAGNRANAWMVHNDRDGITRENRATATVSVRCVGR